MKLTVILVAVASATVNFYDDNPGEFFKGER